MDEHALFELAGKGFDFALFKLHESVAESEEGVIGTARDVLAGMILGTTLADDDIAFHSDLVAVNLNAEAF